MYYFSVNQSWLLPSVVNPIKHNECVSLTNQKHKTQLTKINLLPNEYTPGLSYYPFAA